MRELPDYLRPLPGPNDGGRAPRAAAAREPEVDAESSRA